MSANRPRLGLRYSLRALLILVTLASVATWYWYQVPYTQEFAYPGKNGWIGVDIQFNSIARRVSVAREVRQFRRQLWNDPIRDGVTELYDAFGSHVGQEHWQEGQLHGAWRRWFPSGQLLATGYFQQGRKHGLWEIFDEKGNRLVSMNYDRGRPHGDAELTLLCQVRGASSRDPFASIDTLFDAESGSTAGGQPAMSSKPIRITLRFDYGELTLVNSHVVLDMLGRSHRLRQIDSVGIEELFKAPTQAEFVDTPLKDVVAYTAETYRVNTVVDPMCGPLADAPINLTAENMSPHVMLVLALAPHELTACYRHGCIWITTKEDAKEWVDRTGASDLLKSPPAGLSARGLEEMKQKLNRPLTISFVGMSAADVANHLRTAVPINWAGAAEGPKISTGFRELPLRHILGAICEQHDLRIRWSEGATLTIEPQERVTP